MNSLNPMRTLTHEQVERIRAATEELLETVGFTVQHEGLLDRARAAGAKVDHTSGRVRIPAPLLGELISQVPPRYTVRNVLGETWQVGGDEQHGMAIVTDPWIIDYETQEPRRPCLEDLRRHTIIAQKLEPVIDISRMDFPVSDCEDATSSLRALEIHLLHRPPLLLTPGPEVVGTDKGLLVMKVDLVLPPAEAIGDEGGHREQHEHDDPGRGDEHVGAISSMFSLVKRGFVVWLVVLALLSSAGLV